MIPINLHHAQQKLIENTLNICQGALVTEVIPNGSRDSVHLLKVELPRCLRIKVGQLTLSFIYCDANPISELFCHMYFHNMTPWD